MPMGMLLGSSNDRSEWPGARPGLDIALSPDSPGFRNRASEDRLILKRDERVIAEPVIAVALAHCHFPARKCARRWSTCPVILTARHASRGNTRWRERARRTLAHDRQRLRLRNPVGRRQDERATLRHRPLLTRGFRVSYGLRVAATRFKGRKRAATVIPHEG